MPESRRSALLRRLRTDWPLLGAAAALLSLLLIPRFIPSRDDLDEEVLRLLYAQFDAHAFEAVEDAARGFLIDSPGSPLSGEVHSLRGRAALALAVVDPDPALPARAWAELGAARRFGFRPGETAVDQARAAHLLLDRGRSDEAAAAFRELLAGGADPAAAFDLGRVLAARAARRPRDAAVLVAEILELAEAAKRRLPPERRFEAVVAAAKLCRRSGRTEDVLPLLEQALREAAGPVERGRLRLEQALCFVRLDRKSEALAALETAGDLLKDDVPSRPARSLAVLELHARAGLTDVPALAEEIDPPVRPVARLYAALWRLSLDRPRGLRDVAELLAAVPALRPLDDAGVDLDWMKRAVRSAAAAEEDPAAVGAAAEAFVQLRRLEPEDVVLLVDRAQALRRQSELLRRGDPAAAAARAGEAGESFAAAAANDGLDVAGQEGAARAGAEAFERAGRPADAARLHRAWYAFSPRRNGEGLLREARALNRAGLQRRALEAYAEYAGRARPGDPGLPEALLERGRILAALGERAEAAAAFQRLLTEDVGITPEAAEWEAALLGRGRALLELGQAAEEGDAKAERMAEARRTLAEYIERYATDGAPRAGVVEASYLLGRAAMEARDWTGAVDALARAAAAEPADERARLYQKEARFLRGDLYFAAGRYDEAERAYAEASRRHAGSPDRLWGVIGRARALARLGRVDEARREARTGRALFEESRPGYEASFDGKGRDYWIAALETIEKELR